MSRKKPVDQMSLKIESRSVNESFARVAVSAFAAQQDPTVEEISDIKTAVSEAVTNCIVHAYPASVGEIYIWVGLFDDGLVRIRIRDRGCGIIDVRQAMEGAAVYDPRRRACGIGLRRHGELYGQGARALRPGQGDERHHG